MRRLSWWGRDKGLGTQAWAVSQRQRTGGRVGLQALGLRRPLWRRPGGGGSAEGAGGVGARAEDCFRMGQWPQELRYSSSSLEDKRRNFCSSLRIKVETCLEVMNNVSRNPA